MVPNYRHARYLPKRLESILSQDFQDFELIILDDCSPDDSRRVIESYLSEPRIRAIFNDTNSGSAYRQWALGLGQSRGEYIWFAESDDYAEPNLLSTLVRRLDTEPDVGLAFCLSAIVDGNGEVIRSAQDWLAQRARQSGYDLSRWVTDFTMPGREYCAQFMYPWNMIDNGSAVLFRRSALEAVGGVVTDLLLCGDWMTYVNVLSASNVAYVASPLNYFRNHSATVRAGTKTDLFYRESRVVLNSMRQRIDSLAGKRLGLGHLDQFVQGLLSPERRPPRQKVPLGRQWRVLGRSFSLTPAAMLVALRILAKENLAELAYRLGLLEVVRQLKRRSAERR